MTLMTYVYVSVASRHFPPDDLESLVAEARRRNQQRGLTGMLLYADGNFMQALEGEEAILDDLVERIAADPRHYRVTRLLRCPIAERSFQGWSMGLVSPLALEHRDREALGSVFAPAAADDAAKLPIARRLLATFARSMRSAA